MRTLVVAGLLMLAGCAKPMEVGSISHIKPTEPGTGFDIYAARRNRGETVPEFAGDQILEVRTYEQKSDSGQVEMAGAACELSSAGFTAQVTTPAKVRVPLYRAQSSTISVSCKKPGYKPRMVEAYAIDKTRQQRYASGAGGGLIGVAVVAAFDAVSDNSQNDWRYTPVRIPMERVRTASVQSGQQ